MVQGNKAPQIIDESVEKEHLGQTKYLDHPAEKPQSALVVHSTVSYPQNYGILTISLHNVGINPVRNDKPSELTIYQQLNENY